jgi:hypothetical protein
MFTQRTPTKPPSPDRLGLPPPLALDLTDTGRRVGWVEGDAIGFRGFGSEVEAAHAAWVAHRGLARRLARRDGRRPIPVDTERLALDRRGDVELVLAGGLPIATLLRPSVDGTTGDDSYGFTLRVPGPADELTMRSLAYTVYLTLRKSGTRWAMWARDGQRAARERGGHAAEATSVVRPAAALDRAASRSTPGLDWGSALLGLVAVLVLAFVAPPTIAGLLAIAGIGVLTVVGVLGWPSRWPERRSRRAARSRRSARGTSATSTTPDRDATRRARRRARVAMVVTIASLVILLLGLAVPERLALTLTGAGLAGLLAIRMFAMPAGWPPRRPVPVRPLTALGAPAWTPGAMEREPADRETTRDAPSVATRDGGDVARDRTACDSASTQRASAPGPQPVVA